MKKKLPDGRASYTSTMYCWSLDKPMAFLLAHRSSGNILLLNRNILSLLASQMLQNIFVKLCDNIYIYIMLQTTIVSGVRRCLVKNIVLLVRTHLAFDIINLKL